MTGFDFCADARAQDFDTAWYTRTLKNTYPVETINVDTLTFNMSGDNIQSVSVTYIERTEEETQAFNAWVEEILTKASNKTTKKDKANAVLREVILKNMAKTESDDIMGCCFNNSGSYLARIRLMGYLLEKLDIRYMIYYDRMVYPYIRIIDNGTEWYYSVLNGYLGLSNMKSSSLFDLMPVFYFTSPEEETAYLNQ